eukprot:scaffold1113_cov379-Prasinococcus_capsulatus_cf.AAC.9
MFTEKSGAPWPPCTLALRRSRSSPSANQCRCNIVLSNARVGERPLALEVTRGPCRRPVWELHAEPARERHRAGDEDLHWAPIDLTEAKYEPKCNYY